MALLVAATASGTAALGAEKRIALVIGNSAYQHATELTNPRNDAEDIAAALQKLDFKVIKGLDLDKTGMDRTTREFADAARGAGIALFFYAGHGLQVNGRNYLVPVDAQLKTVEALDFEMVGLDVVQRTMEGVSDTNVLFVDACRDNPLARNLARAMGTRSAAIGHGLVAQEAGAGTLISFSTQPGNVALDGTGGRNSPYAAALAKHINTQEKDLSGMLLMVRRDVMTATGKRQVPWEHSALTAEIRLAQPAPAPAPAPKPTSVAAAPETVAAVKSEATAPAPNSGNSPAPTAAPANPAAPVAKAEEPRRNVVNVKRSTGVLSFDNASGPQVVFDETGTIRVTKGFILENKSIDLPSGVYTIKDFHQEHVTIAKLEMRAGERTEFDKVTGSLSLQNARRPQVVYDEAGTTRITKGFILENKSVDLPPGIYTLRDFHTDHVTIGKFEIAAGRRLEFSDFAGTLSLANAKGPQVVYDETGKTRITKGFILENASIDLPPGVYTLRDFHKENVTIDKVEIKAGEETVLEFGG